MSDTDKELLRRKIQREWEEAMDNLFSNLDAYAQRKQIPDSEMLGAVARQIDQETADAFNEWLED